MKVCLWPCSTQSLNLRLTAFPMVQLLSWSSVLRPMARVKFIPAAPLSMGTSGPIFCPAHQHQPIISAEHALCPAPQGCLVGRTFDFNCKWR